MGPGNPGNPLVPGCPGGPRGPMMDRPGSPGAPGKPVLPGGPGGPGGQRQLNGASLASRIFGKRSASFWSRMESSLWSISLRKTGSRFWSRSRIWFWSWEVRTSTSTHTAVHSADTAVHAPRIPPCPEQVLVLVRVSVLVSISRCGSRTESESNKIQRNPTEAAHSSMRLLPSASPFLIWCLLSVSYSLVSDGSKLLQQEKSIPTF